jgi:hypothetical protein
MGDHSAAAGEDCVPECGRGGLNRGSNHSKRGMEERAGELDGRAKPVQRLLNDAEHVRESGLSRLGSRDAQGCPSTR